MSLFERWKKGETVQVQSTFSGKVFQIRPEQWAGITIGYTILVNGKPVKGYRRKMMGDKDFRQWSNELVDLGENRSPSPR